MTSSCCPPDDTGRCRPNRARTTSSDPADDPTATGVDTDIDSGPGARRSTTGAAPTTCPDGTSTRCCSDFAPTVSSTSDSCPPATGTV